MGQSSELEHEIKQKTGAAAKNLGGHGPPRPPLRIATDSRYQQRHGSSNVMLTNALSLYLPLNIIA